MVEFLKANQVMGFTEIIYHPMLLSKTSIFFSWSTCSLVSDIWNLEFFLIFKKLLIMCHIDRVFYDIYNRIWAVPSNQTCYNLTTKCLSPWRIFSRAQVTRVASDEMYPRVMGMLRVFRDFQIIGLWSKTVELYFFLKEKFESMAHWPLIYFLHTVVTLAFLGLQEKQY